jgi:3-hydroxyisobutyrate dehydrogenase-like beta-hydroxyacid dehydrogenase
MNQEQSAKPRIGFIGLGLMGHGMAKNIVTKGYPLTVRVHRNRRPLEDLLAAGAKEVGTNAEVARNSDIVFLCVTGTPQVEAIVHGADGLLAAAREGFIVVDTSTAEPASTAVLRAAFAEKGALFVDAPLARTPVEAEQGRLNTMVGADDAVFARLKPVLQAFCENVIHAGPPGHGHTLAHNNLAIDCNGDGRFARLRPSGGCARCASSSRPAPSTRESSR